MSTHYRPYFDETPEGLRRLVLLLYSIIGPAFLLVMLLAGRSEMDVAGLFVVAALIATAGIWVFIHRNPTTANWIYPVSISPTLCSGIAFASMHGTAPVFLAVVIAPSILASILFPAPIALVGWITALLVCFSSIAFHFGPGWAAVNTLLYGIISGLVTWVVYKKTNYLRLMTLRLQEKESEILDSKERFRHLTEIFPETIFEADLDLTITYANAHGYAKFAWDSRPLPNILDLVHPDDRKMVRERLGDRIAVKMPMGFFEFRAVALNGETFDALGYAATIMKDGRPTGLRGFVLDITERKLIERRLEESERFLRLLMDNISAGVIVVDSKTRIIEKSNQAALDLIGKAADAIIGRQCHNNICPNGEAKCPILDRGEEVDESERTLLTAGSGRIPILKTVKKITIGNSEKLLETFVDITDLKAAQAALVESESRANALALKAEEASLAKSRFLASMSHEIRTPMNAIIGLTDLLLDQELPAQQRHYVQVVKSSSESLLALINDILDLSKIEAGKVVIEESEFNIRELLESCRTAFEPMVMIKGITIDAVVAGAVPALVRGDPLRLRQVLTNVIGNAVKFTERGGVLVTASLDEEHSGVCTLKFTVKDTGIGIAPEKQHLLFSRFSQVSGETAGKYGGTGLGLAISKSLVELMGGSISVDSEVGKGATFWFTIQARRVTAPSGTAQNLDPNGRRTAVANPAGNNYRILMVEDNAVNQEVAKGILKKLGYANVALCSNGFEALSVLGKERIDLVLMDMQMPGMDGLEATRAIRDPGSSVLSHTVPIIAMTANAMRGDREKCLLAGMNDHVAKPISPAGLAKALAPWLPADGSPVNDRPGTVLPEGNPAFDYDNLLERMMGDIDLIDKGLTAFVSGLPERISALKHSAEANDCSMTELQAHNLKGASATYGLMQVSSIAAEMERAGRTCDLQAVLEAVPELEKRFGDAVQAIHEKMASLRSPASM